MAGWLRQSSANTFETHAAAVSIGEECAEAIIASVLAVEDEALEQEAAASKAAQERARYARKETAWSVTPQPRAAAVPRLSRSFSDVAPTRKRRRPGSADLQRKLQARRRLTTALVATIIRIGKSRTFRRTDVVHGEDISRVEWQAVHGCVQKWSKWLRGH